MGRRPQLPGLGTWISSGSPVVTELAADAGFDWLLIDLEHGNGTEADLPSQLRCFRGTATAPIVRVPAADAAIIARYLDWGARGIMVPHVNSAEEASRCVRAMRYPPHGERGVSRSVRAYGFGRQAFPGNGDDNAPLFIAQLESLPAVEQAAEIAALEGVDVLFIGPADLQFDLQARGSSVSDKYAECLQQVVAAARGAGKAAGILVRNTADLKPLWELGFEWLALESDLGLLRTGYTRMCEQWATLRGQFPE